MDNKLTRFLRNVRKTALADLRVPTRVPQRLGRNPLNVEDRQARDRFALQSHPQCIEPDHSNASR